MSRAGTTAVATRKDICQFWFPRDRRSNLRAVTKPLWAPWRLEYIEQADEQEGCIFCRAAEGDINTVWSCTVAGDAFVLLNKFPYASGHLMVAPYRRTGELAELTDGEVVEIHRLASQGIGALAQLYGPQGFNLGVEPRARRGSRRHRPCPPPRRAALAGRHELHARARRCEVLPEHLAETRARLAEVWP